MDNIKPLSKVPKKPNESVVSILEIALEKAKQGKITGFIMCAEIEDGNCARFIEISKVTNLFQMAGVLNYEIRNLLEVFDERQE